MSFEPPAGILDIGNATLRVGKLEVAETSGLNQGLQNIIKNDLLITENTTYAINHKWGLKLPTTWVAEFEVKGHTGKYIDFNFYNENSASNAQGYNLTFKDTTMTLRYDNGSALGGGAATIPTIVGAYRKVNIFFERGVISVSINGTRYLYHKETDGFNQGLGVASRVVSATGSAFVNLFIELNASNSAFKNLRIVNGRFISDKTSNIAFIGGNLGVGVHSPKETLDIRGNMHFNRVSNVSSISVDSNVVTEYTGPHDRPYRKYPEVAMTANDNLSASGYVASRSSGDSTYDAWKCFNGTIGGDDWDNWLSSAFYATGTGDATVSGAASTTVSGVSGAVIGEWVQLKLPKPICLKDVALAPMMYGGTTYAAPRAPTKGVVAGSIDGTNWELVKSFTAVGLQSFPQNYYASSIGAFSSSKYYNYFRLIIEEVTGGTNGDRVALGEVCFYGYEKGDASLDTTLKSVYNVPATTGTQLEVYYDAKDLANGAVTSVTDLSPNTNGGTGTDVTVADGAFVFNGTSSLMEKTSLSIPGGDNPFTFSFWLKNDDFDSNQYILRLGDNTTPYQTVALYKNSSNQIIFASFTLDFPIDYTFTSGQWNHISLVYPGGGWKHSNLIAYIDGRPYTFGGNVSSGGVGGTILSLATSLTLRLGGFAAGNTHLDGSIANFRLYSKALNAGQAKELYDYQKDYFLGSKSQVTLYKGHLGVGVAEPSGQLELAGDERIQEYPPRGLTGYETLVEGHGVFCIKHSGHHSSGPILNAFNKKAPVGDFWYSVVSTYGGTNNLYTGSDVAPNGVNGEWMYMTLPYHVDMKFLQLTARNGEANSGPKSGIIFGSADGGTTWDQVGSWSDKTTANFWLDGGVPSPNFTINSTKPLNAVGFVVTHGQNTYAFTLGEIKFFGTPGPTTLDKGSLTLGRSLDVPRVSRYDVDTETPRPEKLVVDFDTTVNSSPTDISGKGNHGAFYGSASYSAVDKAFDIAGTPAGSAAPSTSAYVQMGPISSFSGNQAHTISLWFKKNNVSQDYSLVNMWKSGSNYGTVGHHSGLLVLSNGKFQFWHYGGDAIYTDPVGDTSYGDWRHVVGVYTGTTVANQKLYVNGIEATLSSYGSGNGSETIDITNATITLGKDHNRGAHFFQANTEFSNPKIYNVALEASEVKKLYNLGRTGRSMVISDTVVGIGKVPEAQLDVRGSGGFTGDLTVGGNMNNYQYWFRGNRNGQSTNGATAGGLLYVQFSAIAGLSSAWIGSNRYICPVDGVYMTHGNFMAFPNINQAGYCWVEVRRYNSAGTQLDAGSAMDMHTPYRDDVYQSWHFQQTHLCKKGDYLHVIYTASTANAHLDLHPSWGNINIYKIG